MEGDTRREVFGDEFDVAFAVAAGDVEQCGVAVAAWHGHPLALLGVVAVKLGDVDLKERLGGDRLDAVDVVGAAVEEVVADAEDVVAIFGNAEVERAVGGPVFVIGPLDALAVFGVVDVGDGVERGAERAGEGLNGERLALFR